MCNHKNCCYHTHCKNGLGGGMETVKLDNSFASTLAIKVLVERPLPANGFAEKVNVIRALISQGKSQEILHLIHTEQVAEKCFAF